MNNQIFVYQNVNIFKNDLKYFYDQTKSLKYLIFELKIILDQFF
jgi:hypothetical protein